MQRRTYGLGLGLYTPQLVAKEINAPEYATTLSALS